MKDRMLQLMNHLGLTAARFADEMGVQRSGISHILSGRNQPSFDFLVKLINKYPDISLEWFLTGRGDMVRSVNPGIAPNITRESLPKITSVNNIQRIVLLFTDGTFKHYDPAGQD